MLMPRKVKHRKQQRGRLSGTAKGGTTVTFGEFGIQALEPGWITARQIEAARIAMTRHVRRGGKVWIRIFPDKPVTQKPAETRMGSGKGNPEHWVAVVKPGGRQRGAGSLSHGTRHPEAAHKGQDRGPVRGGRGLMTTAADFRQMDPDELRSRLGETKQELFNLRFQLVTGQLDNSERLGQLRRDVARILTVLREREIEEAEALEASEKAAAQAAPATAGDRGGEA